ncbi:hypothetical protein F511_42241 [Dorcoceras hygrometricum]|uniref:Uncharacterized protein n=1 Tax=Dorcoceras hygrometricum TaxID=472368 RepID=A0A2Z7CU25_9LAMI|nr:hypothetical protein F511_42241 [Dorcoceras hygrometricum]
MAKATEACKRKGRKYCSCVGTLQRSVAQLWKEDKIAFWSAEEFLEAFQREVFYRGYIFEATPIEDVSVDRVNETLCVRSVGATTYCGKITLNIQCTNRGKNREIDEAINRH